MVVLSLSLSEICPPLHPLPTITLSAWIVTVIPVGTELLLVWSSRDAEIERDVPKGAEGLEQQQVGSSLLLSHGMLLLANPSRERETLPTADTLPAGGLKMGSAVFSQHSWLPHINGADPIWCLREQGTIPPSVVSVGLGKP